jgi:hypothetical protein
VFLACAGGRLDVAPPFCLVDVLVELVEPSLVRLAGGLVDQRVVGRAAAVQARGSGVSSAARGRRQSVAGQVQDVDLPAW